MLGLLVIFLVLYFGLTVTDINQFIICKKKIFVLPVLDEEYPTSYEIKYDKIAYVDWITIRMSSKESVSFLEKDPFSMADIHYSVDKGAMADDYKRKIVIVTKKLEIYEIDETQCEAYNAFSILYELFKDKGVKVFRKYR
ncbi:MAG: hypothetical protein AAF335_03815 [Bacteroidota bacterium]